MRNRIVLQSLGVALAVNAEVVSEWVSAVGGTSDVEALTATADFPADVTIFLERCYTLDAARVGVPVAKYTTSRIVTANNADPVLRGAPVLNFIRARIRNTGAGATTGNVTVLAESA